NAEETQRVRLGGHAEVHGFRQRDEERIARRVRLMFGDVEVAHAECEIDRVEILERWRKERQGESGESKPERNAPSARLKGSPYIRSARLQPCDHDGRSTIPSFRLPVR